MNDDVEATLQAMITALLALKLPLLLAWIIGLFALERLWPFAMPPPELRQARSARLRLGRNLGLAAVTAGLSAAVVLPLSAAAALHPLWARPAWLSGAVGLLVDLILLDLWIYFWHRANHEVPLLWRFHQVHHRDRFLDTTTALRFHFGEVLLSALVRAVVIVLAAVPLVSVLVFEVLVTMSAVFHHSNVRLPPLFERRLAWLIITPSRHWVHHHAVRRDTDSNYGAILSVWDKLFGSRATTARTPDLTIGVEGEAELSLSRLLVLPWRGIGSAARGDQR